MADSDPKDTLMKFLCDPFSDDQDDGDAVTQTTSNAAQSPLVKPNDTAAGQTPVAPSCARCGYAGGSHEAYSKSPGGALICDDCLVYDELDTGRFDQTHEIVWLPQFTPGELSHLVKLVSISILFEKTMENALTSEIRSRRTGLESLKKLCADEPIDLQVAFDKVLNVVNREQVEMLRSGRKEVLDIIGTNSIAEWRSLKTYFSDEVLKSLARGIRYVPKKSDPKLAGPASISEFLVAIDHQISLRQKDELEEDVSALVTDDDADPEQEPSQGVARMGGIDAGDAT